MTRMKFLPLIFTLLFSVAFAQKKDKNILQKGGDQAKLFQAGQFFNAGDYVKALNLYKEVLNSDQNNANVNYRLGEVYHAMELYDDAVEFLEKALSIDPKCNEDMLYILAHTHHMLEKVDMALEEYEKFKAGTTEGKVNDYDINLLISQCKSAKDLMKAPVTVTVSNAGDMINSSYDDKGPSITADGKTFVFTSRRPQGKKGQEVDKEGDFKFFEDIYMSTWDDGKQNFSEAEMIKGSVNSEGHDAVLSISPDGKQIFIYRNDDGEARGGEILISKVQQTGKWGAPKLLGKPVSTSYAEFGAVISSDGKTLYFVSESPKYGEQKGFGHGDIWMVKKISKTEWGLPVNLGSEINTQFDEGGIFLHPDGKTLFFSSEGHNSMGSYDIFMTRLENGKWSKPVNLGYPINTVRKDVSFVLTTDNNTAYFASDRPGGMGERDIYKVDMSKYLIMKDEKEVTDNGPKISILKGNVTIIESGKGAPDVEVIITDKETGKQAGTTNTNEDGEYFFTLPSDKTYIVEVTQSGYKKYTKELLLKSAKTGTATEFLIILLDKEKK